MFIGRERELRSLQNTYDRPGFGMIVIYGRRRIGKSTLIARFITGKKAIFYTATKVGGGRNLELFAEQVTAVLEPELKGVSFPTPESIFDLISRKLTDEKLILVIDELPFWAQYDEALLSVLQKYIDTQWLNRNLMIILCGSSLSFMESRVLSEKSPLFGRRTSQIRLDAFNYRESALFVSRYSNEEKALCYGITGGTARYLALIDDTKSLDDNIIRLFFSTDGYLYDETRNLLAQEFTDITLVNNIIEQIASGENTVNAIAGKVHEKEPTVLYSLEKLIHVGLVERRKCITEESNRKKTQYVLRDHMFKFWYTFIPKAHSVIEIGQGARYYEFVVKPQLHSFMGGVFEEMCRFYTLEKGTQGRFGSFLTEVGSWWGKETFVDSDGNRRHQSADIDVVGISEIDGTAVIGECKFRRARIDKGVYDTLVRRSGLLSGKYRIIRYLLFSLSGYTEWFDLLDAPGTLLLSLEDLYADDLCT